MRDEDLKSLPQSTEAWKIKEMLETLGITDWTNVAEMHVYPREVQVTVYATDADGRRYWVETPTQIEVTDLADPKPSYVAGHPDRKPAVHEISIPIVGPWEKPDGEADPHNLLGPCGAWKKLGGRRMECVLQPGHEGDHVYSKDTGRILSDSPQA